MDKGFYLDIFNSWGYGTFNVDNGDLWFSTNLSLYGLETNYPFSLTGIFLILIFSFKGLVAFSLWTEKAWAIKLAIADAVIGIVVCTVMMFIIPSIESDSSFNLTLRLE